MTGGVGQNGFGCSSDGWGRKGIAGITGAVFAANIVCVAGSMMMVFAPLFIDALRRANDAGFERRISLIGSADETGMFAGAILALFAVPKLDRRMLATLGLGMLCLGDLLSLTTTNLSVSLYASRFLAGVGGGLAMAVAYAAFGASRQPERSFALYGMLQTLVGGVSILYLAPFVPKYGAGTLYCASLALALAGLGAGFLMDGRRSSPDVSSTRSAPPRGGVPWTLGTMTCITYFLFGLDAIALWANSESIGRSFGLSHRATSIALSVSLLGSVTGSLLVMLTGNRWGRALPTACISIVYLGGIALLFFPQGFTGFLVAVTAFQFGTNLGSHAFGAISEADSSGRLSIVYLLSLKGGFATGPLAASMLIDHDGYHRVVGAVAIASVATCILIGVTLATANKRASTQTSDQSRDFR